MNILRSISRLSASLVFLVSILASPCALNSQQSACSKDAKPIKCQTTDAYRLAFADPQDAQAFKRFKESLPVSGDYFVLEGDILVTENELHAYLDAHSPHATSDKSKELLVATLPDGQLDFYKEIPRRTLTYAVDRQSFPTTQQYSQVVSSIEAAAQDWMEACLECKIIFQHKKDLDSNASVTTTNFVVRYLDVHGAYIAASFFPHDAPMRRFLNVDPSYFTTQFDRIGVFRHELGHVLGYRHEHIQNIAGCFMEDNAWSPLTPYDPHSVMHYYCGGGGTLSLQLTDVDIVGHRRLYGGTSSSALSNVPPKDSRGTLIVSLNEGDISERVLRVINVLKEHGQLPVNTVAGLENESLAEFYTEKLQVPISDNAASAVASVLDPGLNNKRSAKGFTDKVATAVASVLNPDLNNKRSAIRSATIPYPDISFTQRTVIEAFDLTNQDDIRRKNAILPSWGILESQRLPATSGSIIRIRVPIYELRIDMPTTQAEVIAQELNSAKDPGLVSAYVDVHSRGTYFSRVPSSSLISRINRRDLVLNDEAFIGDELRVPLGEYDSALSSGQQLLLVDQSIGHHPDLEGNVDGLNGSILSDPINITTGALNLVATDFSKDADHGSHLAGLMVARHNGYGIAGVNPDGHIVSWNWEAFRADPNAFKDDVQETEEGPSPIFVFASSWRADYEGFVKNLFKYVRSSLWIVAAGETNSDKPDACSGQTIPINILPGTSCFPMSHGQEANVIVVTACAECYGNGSRIAEYANYSSMGLVQIAAPGGPIPSTVSHGAYAPASGTSQAAAITAGLVSRMVQRWPNHYLHEPAKVKFRLQLTSWPGLNEPDELAKVSSMTGVLDGRAALLDPETSWMLLPMGPAGREEYVPVAANRWCQQTISFRTSDGKPTVTLKDVRRIVKIHGSWVIVSWASDSDVVRIGPGALDGNSNQLPLVQTDKGVFSLSQISDLILERQVKPGECTQ